MKDVVKRSWLGKNGLLANTGILRRRLKFVFQSSSINVELNHDSHVANVSDSVWIAILRARMPKQDPLCCATILTLNISENHSPAAWQVIFNSLRTLFPCSSWLSEPLDASLDP